MDRHADFDVGDVEPEVHLRVAARAYFVALFVELADMRVFEAAQSEREGRADVRERVDRYARAEAHLEGGIFRLVLFVRGRPIGRRRGCRPW